MPVYTVYMQAYVTCAVGVHYVGFVMMTLAMTSGIAGYISGHLHLHIGRISLILTGQVKRNANYLCFAIAYYRLVAFSLAGYHQFVCFYVCIYIMC